MEGIEITEGKKRGGEGRKEGRKKERKEGRKEGRKEWKWLKEKKEEGS